VRDLVTQHYPLEETPRALEDSAGRNRGIKSMVTIAPEEALPRDARTGLVENSRRRGLREQAGTT
jgi:hypothetical protein